MVLLKYLSNVWRSLDLLLINCELKPKLWWSKNCRISEVFNIPEIDANPTAAALIANAPAASTASTLFQIYITKLYLLVANWSIKNHIKLIVTIDICLRQTL